MLNKHDLIDYLASGCKPRSHWRIGLEHEQFAYYKSDDTPLPYDGISGIKQILQEFVQRFHWQPKYEGENIIALSKDGQSITLEPAGQIELSGAPHKDFHGCIEEHQNFLSELHNIGERLGVGFLSQGVHPNWSRDDMHWMPKARYDIMRPYMHSRGSHGIDMMTRSCGAQINLDFDSEDDMVRKFRVTMGLQPIISALLANSRVIEGKDSGYASMRAQIWRNTDADRCGVLPFVFEDSMGFERYVDYMLDVPMYFIMRKGQMINMAGKSFRDFLSGKLPENRKYQASLNDWEDHLSTAFPEVRLKKYLELRGADSVAPPLLYDFIAFWVGLIYDHEALTAAEEMIKNWKAADHLIFKDDAAKYGLEAKIPQANTIIRSFAPELITLAKSGLSRLGQSHQGAAELSALKNRLHAEALP